LTDAELLQRWVVSLDEAAFEALLWRHAATVVGVCRRVLRDAHEAEDAAQAAFLALARKASSIGRRQAVAAWLYTVAYRAAVQARARLVRHAACGAHNLDALPARPAEDPAWRDLRPVLDEEVSRLPQKYRAVFVLCHVEGRTNAEAARELRCPVGTVLSRLSRARQRLRDRLTRRGVTLTAALFSTALIRDVAAASVPGGLVRSAASAAASAAAGKGLVGIVSAEAAALAEGVVKAMLVTKIKVAGIVMVLGAALLGGGAVLTTRMEAGAPAAQTQLAPVAQNRRPPGNDDNRPAPGDDARLKALLEQKELEITKLRDRIEALEKLAVEQRSQLEALLKEKQLVPDRAAILDQEVQKLRDGLLPARKVAADLQAVQKPPPEGGDSTAGRPKEYLSSAPTLAGAKAMQVQDAQDQVELLEAQLVARQALLKAATLSLDVARAEAKRGDSDVKTRLEAAALAGQVEVRVAELRESEIRLAQAKRRLARLQGGATSGVDPVRQKIEQRAAELEKKLDALNKEMEVLRKELQSKGPVRP
jgi:RNA polymerase sigma factor (sigma-70 family)